MTDPIELPEDTSTEDGIRDLLRFMELGESADGRLSECVHSLLSLADKLARAHPDYQTFLRDPWKSPLLNTLFDTRPYIYLRKVEYRGDEAHLHMWERGCKGDSDSAGEVITIPLAYLWTPYAEQRVFLSAELARLIEVHRQKQERIRLSAEAGERAKLAELLSKYPDAKV